VEEEGRERWWRAGGVVAGAGNDDNTKTVNSRGWAPKGDRKSQSQADYSFTMG
jgi:hypothetical protein